MGPQARVSLSMVFDEVRNRVLLTGGSGHPETWAWDGMSWIQVADMGPVGYVGSQKVYDSIRERVVFYVAPATWEWRRLCPCFVRELFPTGPNVGQHRDGHTHEVLWA